jgi:lambda repressor-like predicted transcriptional regulator
VLVACVVLKATGSRRVNGWYDAAPLIAELRRHAIRRGRSISGLADDLRIDCRTLQRALARRAVRSDTADHLAIALGRHPCELWPEWFH